MQSRSVTSQLETAMLPSYWWITALLLWQRECACDWIFSGGYTASVAKITVFLNESQVSNEDNHRPVMVTALGMFRSARATSVLGRLILDPAEDSAISSSWLALLERDNEADFHRRIVAAISHGCSAVVFFDSRDERGHTFVHLPPRLGATVVIVQVSHNVGLQLELLLATNVSINVSIQPKTPQIDGSSGKTSVSPVFTYFSLVVLAVILIVWMFIYCVLRTRLLQNASAKRTQLTYTCRRVLQMLSVRTLSPVDVSGDLCSCCIICLDNYHSGDRVTVLPCRHYFHRFCIEPWLIQNMQCPICKLHLPTHFGLVSSSEESIVELEETPAHTSPAVVSLRTSSSSLISLRRQQNRLAVRTSGEPMRRSSDTMCSRSSISARSNIADGGVVQNRRSSAPTRPSLMTLK